MSVARLALTDVRSYTEALIAPAPGLVILTGENGAGKTNLLEAVSLLAPGRGLRGAALSEVARADGPGGFGIAARLADGTELGVGTLAAAPERRVIRINGAAASATALGERLSVLWLTPAMDRLFADTAGARRRFLDRLVLAFEPAHATHATRYEAAMRARNRLLAEPETADAAWLNAIEASLAEHGAALAAARTRLVETLEARLAGEMAGPFARPAIRLGGWLPEADDPVGSLARALRAGRARDAAAGRTLAGPHRTDLLVRHRDKDQPAERCSTGEQKALLLGLVLAHSDLLAERQGRRPVLLLDEVAAHLDPARRGALIDRLAEAGGQVWMTGTEAALFDAAPADAQRLLVTPVGVIVAG